MPYSPSPRGQITYIRVKSTTASSPPKRRIAINSHIVTTRCLSRSSASWSRRGPSCFCMFVPDLFSAKVEPRVLSIRGRCPRSPFHLAIPGALAGFRRALGFRAGIGVVRLHQFFGAGPALPCSWGSIAWARRDPLLSAQAGDRGGSDGRKGEPQKRFADQPHFFDPAGRG